MLQDTDNILHSVYEALDGCHSEAISDIHITSDKFTWIRENGDISQADYIVSKEAVLDFLKGLNRFNCGTEEVTSSDFAFSYNNVRYRCNAYKSYTFDEKVKDTDNYSLAIRVLSNKIPNIDDLRLPSAVTDLCEARQGLILVSGVTGSGKSTTMAAMIKYMNDTRSSNIITLEDPIEYLHTDNKCRIIQREIHRDTQSFSQGVKDAMREDPDIILVGELRDSDTLSNALTLAETGHLVLGTLHARNSVDVIGRIVNTYPGDMQNQVKLQLAAVLYASVHQTLVKTKTGSRVPLVEVMRNIESVRSAILKDKFVEDSIRGDLRSHRREGCLSEIDSAIDLYDKDFVDDETIKHYLTDESFRVYMAQRG